MGDKYVPDSISEWLRHGDLVGIPYMDMTVIIGSSAATAWQIERILDMIPKWLYVRIVDNVLDGVLSVSLDCN